MEHVEKLLEQSQGMSPASAKLKENLLEHYNAYMTNKEDLNSYPYAPTILCISLIEKLDENIVYNAIKQLDELGCNVKSKDSDGINALMYAYLGGYASIIKYLEGKRDGPQGKVSCWLQCNDDGRAWRSYKPYRKL